MADMRFFIMQGQREDLIIDFRENLGFPIRNVIGRFEPCSLLRVGVFVYDDSERIKEIRKVCEITGKSNVDLNPFSRWHVFSNPCNILSLRKWESFTEYNSMNQDEKERFLELAKFTIDRYMNGGMKVNRFRG